jgi:hypothetical protein
MERETRPVPDDRLRKLVLMLSSDQPGEVAAAAKAIDRVLKVHTAIAPAAPIPYP